MRMKLGVHFELKMGRSASRSRYSFGRCYSYSWLISLLFITSTSSNFKCKNKGLGWTIDSDSGSCLKLYSSAAPFEEAVKTCQNHDSGLVSILNLDKKDFVYEQIIKSQRDEGFWIGANDEETEGVFMWKHMNADVTFEDWAPGEPLNTDDKDCVYVSNLAGVITPWTVTDCETNYTVMCENEAVCVDGKFGEDCTSECSRNCLGLGRPCHGETGACTNGCAIGYQGETCNTACPNGTYGHQCGSECSRACKGDPPHCNKMTGKCDQGCSPGYTEEFCTAPCTNTTFGQDCTQECSQHCVDGVCLNTNGSCLLGCMAGFVGDQCFEPKAVGEDGNTTTVIIFVVILIVVLMGVVALLFAFMPVKAVRTSIGAVKKAVRKPDAVSGSCTSGTESSYYTSGEMSSGVKTSGASSGEKGSRSKAKRDSAASRGGVKFSPSTQFQNFGTPVD